MGNHDIYILELLFHIEHDSISQYIRALEEAQQQAERSFVPITNATLVMISAKAVLESQHFPMTNKKWEELGKYSQTWGKWKEIYKKSDKQAMVKRQAVGGRD